MKNLKTEKEIRDFFDTKSLTELFYLQSLYCGPHKYLTRRRLDISDLFCRILNEQTQTRTFEDLVLGSTNE